MRRTPKQPAGNHYDKYRTRNPIARALVNGFLDSFDELVRMAAPPGTAIEVGCGEGELSMRLARSGWSVEACDIAPEALAEARRRIDASGLLVATRQLDARSLPSDFRPADLVVCCEVLEHLDEPEAVVLKLLELSKRHVLVSVPREPLWRAMNMVRLSYLGNFGNTPGHLQHWSGRGFVSLMARHAEIVEVRSPLPWTQVLCRVG